jgi:two-component system response regulator YesN
VLLKVIIADDEPRVCRLIQYLVDWQQMGFEVIGTAHNGRDALELVTNDMPDVIITDIRMPECDGLKFIERVKALNPEIASIVISGHRQFEYAHSAIQHGAEDYLLKPVKQAELVNALQRIIDKRSRNHSLIVRQDNLEQQINLETMKFKSLLIIDLLNGSPAVRQRLNRDEIRRYYHIQFDKPLFLAANLKIDLQSSQNSIDSSGLVKNKILHTVERMLSNDRFESCISPNNDSIIFIINYLLEDYTLIRSVFRHIIYEIKNLNDATTKIYTTFTLGPVVAAVEQLPDALIQARNAIPDRIVLGVDTIIDYQPDESILTLKDIIQSTQLQKLHNLEDQTSKAAVLAILDQVSESLASLPKVNGRQIMAIYTEILEIFAIGIKPFLNDQDLQSFNSCSSLQLSNCITSSQVAESVTKAVTVALEMIETQRDTRNRRPVLEARQWVEKNYNQPCSLDDISQRVGFNPAYFSTLFKKEIGQSYLEYLTMIRIKAAKRLLRDTLDSVSSIAEAVGYNDEKYFSRVFRKTTGLSPSEFRKLYA